MQREQFPLGWEVIIDEDKKIFFILGTNTIDDNVVATALHLHEVGHSQIYQETPLLKTFPTKELLIEYYRKKNHTFIDKDCISYYKT